MNMDKIVLFLREYVFIFSILLMIVGVILLSMGVMYYAFPTANIDFVMNIGEWNFYIGILGLIALAFGIYYLYSFEKNKRFVEKELQTQKRSEFLKRHIEVRNTVKHLPSKYSQLLKQKEKELRIK